MNQIPVFRCSKIRMVASKFSVMQLCMEKKMKKIQLEMRGYPKDT